MWYVLGQGSGIAVHKGAELLLHGNSGGQLDHLLKVEHNYLPRLPIGEFTENRRSLCCCYRCAHSLMLATEPGYFATKVGVPVSEERVNNMDHS